MAEGLALRLGLLDIEFSDLMAELGVPFDQFVHIDVLVEADFKTHVSNTLDLGLSDDMPLWAPAPIEDRDPSFRAMAVVVLPQFMSLANPLAGPKNRRLWTSYAWILKSLTVLLGNPTDISGSRLMEFWAPGFYFLQP